MCLDLVPSTHISGLLLYNHVVKAYVTGFRETYYLHTNEIIRISDCIFVALSHIPTKLISAIILVIEGIPSVCITLSCNLTLVKYVMYHQD